MGRSDFRPCPTRKTAWRQVYAIRLIWKTLITSIRFITLVSIRVRWESWREDAEDRCWPPVNSSTWVIWMKSAAVSVLYCVIAGISTFVRTIWSIRRILCWIPGMSVSGWYLYRDFRMRPSARIMSVRHRSFCTERVEKCRTVHSNTGDSIFIIIRRCRCVRICFTVGWIIRLMFAMILCATLLIAVYTASIGKRVSRNAFRNWVFSAISICNISLRTLRQLVTRWTCVCRLRLINRMTRNWNSTWPPRAITRQAPVHLSAWPVTMYLGEERRGMSS